MSLRTAILIPSLGVLLLVGVLGGWLAGRVARERTTADLLDRAERYALALARHQVQPDAGGLALLRAALGADIVVAVDTPLAPDIEASTLDPDQARRYLANSFQSRGRHTYAGPAATYQAFSARDPQNDTRVYSVLVPETGLNEAADAAYRTVFTTTLVAAALVAGLVYVLLRGLTGRVVQLRERVAEAQARLTAGGPPPVARSGNELAQLQADFETLVARLADAQQALVHQTRERTTADVVAAVVHDLRNPLQALQILLQMLGAQRIPVGEQARALEVAGGEVERLKHLCEDLQILGGHRPVQCERFAVAPVLQRCAQFYGPKAEARQVRVAVQADPGLAVSADPTAFARAVGNALLNAIQAAPAGSTVDVAVATVPGEEAGAVRITLRNAGGPLPAAVLAGASGVLASSRSGGCGLGLAIIRRAVTQHGGRVTLRNVPEGVIVELDWPAPPAGPPGPGPA